MSEPISPNLQRRIEKVTRERFQLGVREFKRQRRSVVKSLRTLGMPDSEIARMLGVTVQYLAREFPKAKKARHA
jgi:DNA invertase Pin-like site-specific DNA recombinase